MHNGILLLSEEDKVITISGKWMDLEKITLNEVTQTLKDKQHPLSHILRYEYMTLSSFCFFLILLEVHSQCFNLTCVSINTVADASK